MGDFLDNHHYFRKCAKKQLHKKKRMKMMALKSKVPTNKDTKKNSLVV